MFLILYGKVKLKAKKQGVFKECIMGESFGEESALYNKNYLR